MNPVAMELYGMAMRTALALSLPVVGLVAIIGVLVAMIQTVVGISDQNISFGPKLAAVAVVLFVGGMPALGILVALLRAAILTLPRLAT
jgi:flagellar biosynthesis protein FliQ